MFFKRKTNFLVTGAKGQLGSYLSRELQKMSLKQHSIVGQVFGIDIDDLDLVDTSAVADFFNRSTIDPPVKIDYVIHCAAATDTAAIERDPLKYYASTVIGTKNVAESCAYNGIRMIHISTDYVLSELSPMGFAGEKIEFPVNQYGMHKLLAEKEAQLAYLKAGHPKHLLIGRLSWLFGNSKNTFIEKLLRGICCTYMSALKDGVLDGSIEHKVVDDAFGRPTPVDLVLKKVIEAVDGKRSGVEDFQYCGPQVSRIEWASIIWELFCSNAAERRNSADSIELERLSDMCKRVKLAAVKSAELGLSMRHPGKVDTKSVGTIDKYVVCTSKYIYDNFSAICNDVVLKTLKGA